MTQSFNHAAHLFGSILSKTSKRLMFPQNLTKFSVTTGKTTWTFEITKTAIDQTPCPTSPTIPKQEREATIKTTDLNKRATEAIEINKVSIKTKTISEINNHINKLAKFNNNTYLRVKLPTKIGIMPPTEGTLSSQPVVEQDDKNVKKRKAVNNAAISQ